MVTDEKYLSAGLSYRAWWNNERMSRITRMNAGFCAFVCILLKLLRISDTVFDITKKDVPLSDDVRDDKDVGTTMLLLQLTIMFIKVLRLQPLMPTHNGNGVGGMYANQPPMTTYKINKTTMVEKMVRVRATRKRQCWRRWLGFSQFYLPKNIMTARRHNTNAGQGRRRRLQCCTRRTSKIARRHNTNGPVEDEALGFEHERHERTRKMRERER
ncbi:putative cellulose synthase-like protein [Vigna angularis]|uniref:Putative cellulose synthase-like protein n=1 Tax=Phaseolus angularis TaxID=3914 RepID=A0A8T0KBZ3_PHAAN|nr:putative cellulose synthase-like protein [Vigna angularis]